MNESPISCTECFVARVTPESSLSGYPRQTEKEYSTLMDVVR